MATLPMIQNIIDSLIADTAAVNAVVPMTMVSVVPKDQVKPPVDIVYVIGTPDQVKNKVLAWLKGNIDLHGFSARNNGIPIVMNHITGMQSAAHVF